MLLQATGMFTEQKKTQRAVVEQGLHIELQIKLRELELLAWNGNDPVDVPSAAIFTDTREITPCAFSLALLHTSVLRSH
jgi:hypothetical protein